MRALVRIFTAMRTVCACAVSKPESRARYLGQRLAAERRREVDVAPLGLAEELGTLVELGGHVQHMDLIAQQHCSTRAISIM